MRVPTVRFGDLYAEPSRNGLSRPQRVRGSGYRMVNMGELFAHEFIGDQPMELVPMTNVEIARFGLIPGDLLFARQSLVLEGAGKCSIFLGHPEVTTFESHLIRVRLDPTVASALFYYYFFRSFAGRSAIQSITMQVAAAGIRGSELAELPVPAPPLAIQQKLATILSVFDELIENNNRRIRILGDIAHRVFREWFVNFHYPGHEGASLVDSDLGPIPQGWSTGRVGDCATIIRGRSYRGADIVDEGGIPFINLKCVARDGGFRSDGIKRYVGKFKDAHRARTGDIIMAVTDMTQERRIVARAARVPDIGEQFGVFSMDLVKIVPNDLPSEYLLGLFRFSDFPDRVKAYANGANVLHLHPDRISDYRSVFPPAEIARLYSKHVAPMYRLSDELHRANERLREARDILLPRLISGEINVSGLDIAMPEAAA